jgi:hypothetical protein
VEWDGAHGPRTADAPGSGLVRRAACIKRTARMHDRDRRAFAAGALPLSRFLCSSSFSCVCALLASSRRTDPNTHTATLPPPRRRLAANEPTATTSIGRWLAGALALACRVHGSATRSLLTCLQTYAQVFYTITEHGRHNAFFSHTVGISGTCMQWHVPECPTQLAPEPALSAA